MSAKKTGWEARLVNYVRSVSTRKFRPGALDCGLFAGGAIKAMTRSDPTKPFRGKYRKIEDAMSIAASLGFADHVEYAASLYEEIPVLMAQRGDLAAVSDIDGNPALGIVQGENIYVMTLQGIALVRLVTANRAFRI